MNRRNFAQLMGLPMLSLSGARLNAWTADRVIVAGAGIMGASIAYHLAKRGARVTLLEKEHPAAGTTKNSFAWLNAYGKSPRAYYNLNLAGIAGWRRLEIEIGPSLPLQWGRDDQKIDAMKKHVRERQGWGYAVRMVDQGELARLVPYAEIKESGAANFADQEGTVDPVVAAKALVAKSKSLGVKVVYPCDVTGVQSSNGRVKAVQTTQGLMECDSFVLATGNGTMDLAAKAGLAVPLKESKGILVHTTPRPQLVNRIIMPPACNIKQNADGRVVTGTNFEDTGDLQPTREVGEQYLATAASYIPQLKTDQIEFMTLGHRVMPKDGLPIVGRFRNYLTSTWPRCTAG